MKCKDFGQIFDWTLQYKIGLSEIANFACLRVKSMASDFGGLTNCAWLPSIQNLTTKTSSTNFLKNQDM